MTFVWFLRGILNPVGHLVVKCGTTTTPRKSRQNSLTLNPVGHLAVKIGDTSSTRSW